MSLATTSAGMPGGGGGLTIAHHAHGVGQPNVPPPPPQSAAGGGGAPPPLLGADVTNKNQSISGKQAKNVAHLPLLGIDLHAAEPTIAFFPPRPEDPLAGETPVLVGKMKPNVYLKKSEASHKVLRKYLTKSKTFDKFQAECMTKTTDKDAVVLHKPHQWVGLRRTQDAPAFVRQQEGVDNDDNNKTKKSHAIAEEVAEGTGAFMVNSTLDGSSEPVGDDFDRVVWKVRLSESKKALTVLPEEAVQMILHQAQVHVAHKVGSSVVNEEEIVDIPSAIALPAWAFHDAAVEALLEATDHSGVFVNRSLCALAGSLLPPIDGGSPSALLQRVLTVRQASRKEFQKTVAQDPEAIWDDEVTLILVGMTEDGIETMAVQISSENLRNVSALFSDFKVISNVSYQTPDPVSLLEKCAKELEAQVELIASEADGPAGIVFYGAPAHQSKLHDQWEKITPSEWKKVPLITTKTDAVALGAAVFGGVSHGRSTMLRSAGGGAKGRLEMAIQVQDVAFTAVGVRINYHGDNRPSKWEPVKTIFDFDRRVPAGPFNLEFSAAECAVHKSGASVGLNEEQLLKAIKDNEGSKNISLREEAALHLRVQVVQKWTRDGEWMPVGDVMKPLVITDVEDESQQEACESVTLELSLGVTGMITSCLVGDRYVFYDPLECSVSLTSRLLFSHHTVRSLAFLCCRQSVVQATTSARNSTIRFYGGILLAVLFFGGLMVRSYREEYVFNRDVERLMAYYKHAIPGSLADGDLRNAQYLVYKYRNKKERLWQLLEKKYGEPVRQTHEWPTEDEVKTEEEDTVDLDGKDEGEAAEEDETETQEEKGDEHDEF